jgi:hypothetical protein
MGEIEVGVFLTELNQKRLSEQNSELQKEIAHGVTEQSYYECDRIHMA